MSDEDEWAGIRVNKAILNDLWERFAKTTFDFSELIYDTKYALSYRSSGIASPYERMNNNILEAPRICSPQFRITE